jgi:uncharacterized damage-inducible protein DinB
MPRSPEEMTKLFHFNRWANAKVLESASTLTEAELERTLGGSFPSVLGTLGHLYAAEWIWLERLRGVSPPGLPSAQDVPTLAALKEKWSAVEAGQKEFVEGLTDARMDEKVGYRNVKGEPWRYALSELLVHIVNHSTYHRGQVATMFRQLGKKPAATDYLLFLDAGTSGA